jgi:hypothetical protein
VKTRFAVVSSNKNHANDLFWRILAKGVFGVEIHQ